MPSENTQRMTHRRPLLGSRDGGAGVCVCVKCHVKCAHMNAHISHLHQPAQQQSSTPFSKIAASHSIIPSPSSGYSLRSAWMWGKRPSRVAAMRSGSVFRRGIVSRSTWPRYVSCNLATSSVSAPLPCSAALTLLLTVRLRHAIPNPV